MPAETKTLTEVSPSEDEFQPTDYWCSLETDPALPMAF
jgi:hypothetical protein